MGNSDSGDKSTPTSGTLPQTGEKESSQWVTLLGIGSLLAGLSILIGSKRKRKN